MKHLLVWTMLLVALVAAPAVAAPEEVLISSDGLSTILNGDLVVLSDASVATDEGLLFVMARDRKTRRLNWYLVNPESRRINARGMAPFQVYRDFAVAPDGKHAVVHARYPSSLWMLDIAAGKWTCVLKNDNPERLVLSALSSVLFTDSGHAATVLDQQDAEGYVTDSVLARIGVTGTGIQKLASLADLRDRSVAAVKGTAPAGMEYQTEYLRFGEDGSFVFVLQSRSAAEKNRRFLDYLFLAKPDGTLKLVDKSEGGILPLDYHAAEGAILARVKSGGKQVVVLYRGGSKSVVTDKALLMADLLGGGRVAGAAVDDGRLGLYLVPKSGAIQKVQSAGRGYAVAFVRDGRSVLLLSERDLRLLPMAR